MANIWLTLPCRACGLDYHTTAPTPEGLCSVCDNAHDIALRSRDLILPCYGCGDDVTFTVVLAPTGATRIAAVFCSEACSDAKEGPWEAEHDEEEEVAHIRQPFTVDCECDDCERERARINAETLSDDDCPF